jgi:hypothetical protein
MAVLCSAALFGGAVFAQPPAPKLTVVVVAAGDVPPGEKGPLKILETKIQEAFLRDGRFLAITRDETALKQIDAEHIYQRGGAVDEKQIRELGKALAARYICSVRSSQALGSFMLKAELIDIETAKIIVMGSAPCDLVNMGDLIAASGEIVKQLLGPNSAAVKSGGQPGGYGSGLFWDRESVKNAGPMAAELTQMLQTRVNVKEGTCVSGAKIAIESEGEPTCSEGMVGVTCKVNAALLVTQCQGNQKTVLKASLVGADKTSKDAAVKQMMRKAESADFWNDWVKELETRGKR